MINQNSDILLAENKIKVQNGLKICGGGDTKLLRITAEGLPLLKGKLELTFYAQQRGVEEQKNIL